MIFIKTKIINYLKSKNINTSILNDGIKFSIGVDTFVLFVKNEVNKQAEILLLHKNTFNPNRNHKNKIYFDLIDYHLQKDFGKTDDPISCVNYALKHQYKWK